MGYPVEQMHGFDWSAIFGAIAPTATAAGLAVALTPITGSRPTVANYGSYSEISFTPEQEERLSAWILTQLNREPGPVRMDVSGVALKVISRKYWPHALALAAVGLGVGYMVAKKGRG